LYSDDPIAHDGGAGIGPLTLRVIDFRNAVTTSDSARAGAN